MASPAQGVVHRCISREHGLVRIVAGSAACAVDERTFDWFSDADDSFDSWNVELVTVESSADSRRVKSVTVKCPVGKSPVTAGWRIGHTSNDEKIVIMESLRGQSGLSWTVVAEENATLLRDWSLAVTINCARFV